MNKDSSIYLAWHNGLVWFAIYRGLKTQGFSNIIVRNSSELDLRDTEQVRLFFDSQQIDYVFLAAAKVWWIIANSTYPADFIYQNLQIQNNIIHQSYLHGIKKLLFLWSSCIYPKLCPQPIKEEYLLTGPLEASNEPYAIAKISGIKMCQSYNRQYGTNFIACMPTNLFWPWDNFDLTNSHVLPALIRKFHEAKVNWSKQITCRWNGSPLREFLYVDDMASACIFLMINYDTDKDKNNSGDIFCNIGTGVDISIQDLTWLVWKIVWYDGEVVWDTSKPNGTPRKLLDISKINKLWRTAKTSLKEWIQQTYKWYLEKKA